MPWLRLRFAVFAWALASLLVSLWFSARSAQATQLIATLPLASALQVATTQVPSGHSQPEDLWYQIRSATDQLVELGYAIFEGEAA